jgi:Protein of unknown function (DUF4236)
MRLRFRRIISLLPGLRINVGKKSVSASFGPRGAKLTVGTKGVRATVGVPGTGVSLTEYRGWRPTDSSMHKPLGTLRQPVDQRQPDWEFYFLQSLLNDRIKEWDIGWQQSTVRDMNMSTFCRWAEDHVGKLRALNDMLIKLFNVDLVAAIGPPGTPEKIVAAVDSISELLKMVIQWEQEVRVFAEHPVFGDIARKMSGISEPFLEALKEVQNGIDKQIVNLAQTRRIAFRVKMNNVPNADACIKAIGSFEKQLEKRGLEGDFFQTQFQVNRGETSMGRFSRRSVLENLKAGLFQPEDVYWSEGRQAWRCLRELETDGSQQPNY